MEKPKASARDAIFGLVGKLLEAEVNPAEISYALTAEGVDLALKTAPQTEVAFMVVLRAAFDITANHADEAEETLEEDASEDQEEGVPAGVTVH